ncbi:MAG: ABC transporter permease [Gemmatimonadetes bacterium]|nr:ABC transporter permease [Gemmatimonadota bacterium]MCY3942302.1 ABC transporter permease [Gemmatimonadota bacterium]
MSEAAAVEGTSLRHRLRLSWFLARRYLRGGGANSGRRSRFLTFITWIAVGGVTVGVTALIVVIGVMTGMQTELRSRILGSTPHFMVRQSGLSLRLQDWRDVAERAGAVDGVVATAPVAYTKVAIVLREDYAEVLNLFGFALDPDAPPVTATEDSLRSGGLPLESAPGELPPIVLGSGLATRMGAFVGDTVRVVALENLRVSPNGDIVPVAEDWVVAGVFATGMYLYDLENGYTAIANVQRLLGLEEGTASSLWGRVADPWHSADVADSVRSALGGWPYFVDPWTETNRQFFAALKLEKLAMGVIVSLIVLVASFNIVTTLVMVVANRRREIGILKAMGLTPRDTLVVFVLQGLWIGVVGTTAGLALGLILAVLIERYGLIPIPPDIYFVDRLPVLISGWDILWITSVSLLISLLATIYPARQASRLEPVAAIRR